MNVLTSAVYEAVKKNKTLSERVATCDRKSVDRWEAEGSRRNNIARGSSRRK